jgi:hypothetical protein
MQARLETVAGRFDVEPNSLFLEGLGPGSSVSATRRASGSGNKKGLSHL